MGGLSSANWIIERIETFAKNIGEPFSVAEVSMLRRSIDFFNDNNRAEFVKVNAKTVKMIRETIIDEKLAGAETIEVREGLFIPIQWRNNYIEVYNSELSWLISHCAQSAMLHDPTLGETANWESPKILYGSTKSIQKKDEPNRAGKVMSSIEFDLLNSSIQAFISTTDFLLEVKKILAQSLQRVQPDDQENRLRTRIELLNFLNSIGEIDDDVTSAWSLFVLDEKIHDGVEANRNLLREKSKYGTNTVFSRDELKSRGLIMDDFCRKASPFFLDVIAPFDFICKSVGIEPIFAKLYANASVQLAMAIAKSSVFSVDPKNSMNEVYVLSSVLVEVIETLESCEANSESFEELQRELLAITPNDSGVADFLTVLNFGTEIDEFYLDEWSESFSSITSGLLSKSTIQSEIDAEIEDKDASEIHEYEYGNVGTAAARLSQVEDLYKSGLLSDEEYTYKRKQIIDQI